MKAKEAAERYAKRIEQLQMDVSEADNADQSRSRSEWSRRPDGWCCLWSCRAAWLAAGDAAVPGGPQVGRGPGEGEGGRGDEGE